MSPRRKVPTKAELIQLQKLYKTDERIGERLGGVPAYLVAYWRRKKNVPRHSLPKFSESEIRNLWERYGDDDRCGLELGISKAAFYNWRRRYGLREKPPFLKLEQLELNFPGIKTLSRTALLYGKQTISQKILARAAGKKKVEAGELIVVEPDMVTSHDDTGEIVKLFREIGVEYVWNPNKIVVSLSRCGGDGTGSLAAAHKSIREFVKRQGVRYFYDVQGGACHQIVIEQGDILPGQLGLGTGRHTTSYGAVGAFATGIEQREMAAIWASGEIWLNVPKTLRIDISGRRPRGLYAADIALSIIKQLGTRGATYKAIEYYGPIVTQMGISERTTLAGLSVEMGAKAAIFPYESITRRYLTGRTTTNYTAVMADKDAEYEDIFQINIDRLTPQVAGPGCFDRIRAAAELEGLTINQVIIGTGSSGRYDDLRVAADIIKGKQIHDDCRLLIVPASRSVYLEALKKGLIRVFVEAGAIILNPGCRVHPHDDQGLLAQGERCLVTASGEHPEGVDSNKREVYICSAATAAASALNAAVTDPTRYGR